MDWSAVQDWLSSTNLWIIALVLFGAMCAAAAAGTAIRRRRHQRRPPASGSEGQESYIVSAVLGLLALLLGFTFSLAVERFDTRRKLVLEDANAIGTAYLRTQLLGEPHRSRLSDLLVRYTDNRIVLASAQPGPRQQALLAADDAFITDIWAATSAAFDSIKGLDFSSTYVASINNLIDIDAARRTARATRIPVQVFAVLFVYMTTSACVLGYALKGRGERTAAGCLFVLLTLSLVLILDIERPAIGGIVESQLPMIELRKSLTAQPPSTFDRWRTPGGRER